MFHLGNEGSAPEMDGEQMEGAAVSGVGQQPYPLELLMSGLQGERSNLLSCLSHGYFGPFLEWLDVAKPTNQPHSLGELEVVVQSLEGPTVAFYLRPP